MCWTRIEILIVMAMTMNKIGLDIIIQCSKWRDYICRVRGEWFSKVVISKLKRFEQIIPVASRLDAI